MSYCYWTCPHCGANLDPGEKCDCQDTMEQKKQAFKRQLADLHNTRSKECYEKDKQIIH